MRAIIAADVTHAPPPPLDQRGGGAGAPADFLDLIGQLIGSPAAAPADRATTPVPPDPASGPTPSPASAPDRAASPARIGAGPALAYPPAARRSGLAPHPQEGRTAAAAVAAAPTQADPGPPQPTQAVAPSPSPPAAAAAAAKPDSAPGPIGQEPAIASPAPPARPAELGAAAAATPPQQQAEPLPDAIPDAGDIKPLAVLDGTGHPGPAWQAAPPHEPVAAAAGSPAPTDTAPKPPAIRQVAPILIELARSGTQQTLSVQLHPAELGRVDVALVQSAGHAAAIHVTAERPDTLQALAEGHAHLQRALEGTGLTLDGRSLTFGLAGSGGGSLGSSGDPARNGGGSGQGRQAPVPTAPSSADPGDDATAFTAMLRTGIDITA